MNKHMTERWAAGGQYIVCGALRIGEIYGIWNTAPAILARIVAEHNGCLGIEDPETTVPELLAALQDLYDEQNGPRIRHVESWNAAMERTRAVLAKTGKQHDPREPQ